MPRPEKERMVRWPPLFTSFKLAGISARALTQLPLSLDEYEAIRLADYLGMDHAEAAAEMEISRSTFTRLIEKARKKTARLLIDGTRLYIQGGNVHFRGNVCRCQDLCNFHAVIKIKKQVMVFPELCHSCYACSELCPTNSLPMIPQKTGELRQYEAGELVFIEGRLDIGQEQAVPLIAQTIRFVDQHFDGEYLKIFDSPPGTSCPVIEAAKDSDYVILVTEPTPFGLHDLKLTVETMLELNKSFIPPKGKQYIRRYGLYSSRTRGVWQRM